jgi:hypothetical protein
MEFEEGRKGKENYRVSKFSENIFVMVEDIRTYFESY